MADPLFPRNFIFPLVMKTKRKRKGHHLYAISRQTPANHTRTPTRTHTHAFNVTNVPENPVAPQLKLDQNKVLRSQARRIVHVFSEIPSDISSAITFSIQILLLLTLGLIK